MLFEATDEYFSQGTISSLDGLSGHSVFWYSWLLSRMTADFCKLILAFPVVAFIGLLPMAP